MKKILTIGYYADFSKFFKEIANELGKLSGDYEFLHINLHLSGYLYSLLHHQKSVYLPLAASKLSAKQYVNHSTANDGFVQYHIKLNPEIDREKLISQSSKYYCYLDKLLQHFNPDLIIVSGDSRMPVEILQYLAKERGINIYHFEQAPLGRTILDEKGVNANCSCRNVQDINVERIDENEVIIQYKSEKWQGYKKYRLIDLLIEKLFPFLQPIEHIRPKRQSVASSVYDKLILSEFKERVNVTARVYLLVLQVPDDVNMIYHSPFFSSHFEIVKSVHSSLPDNSILVVREHPLFKRLYESELYSYINNHNDVYFDNSPGLRDAMDNADVVVVNNSTVGLEAIQIDKPVVILGNAYYDQFPLCFKYDGGNLTELLSKAAELPDDSELLLRKKYLVYLFNHYFIPGHFRDVNGLAPANIAKWIHHNVH